MAEISLNKYADIVINTVYSGGKGITNISLSKEQVKDEIALSRNRFAEQLFATNRLSRESMAQSVNCIDLEKKDIRNCCDVDSDEKVLHATIPSLLMLKCLDPVIYVGAVGKHKPFKVMYSNAFIYRKYDRWTSKKPTVWIDGTDLWLFDAPKWIKRQISLKGIFSNPRDLDIYSCCHAGDDDPYPIPEAVGDMITGKLINDYFRYYRLQHPQPNTQSELPQSVQQYDIDIRTS